MDLTTAETRARIACRIYLTLFDAGDQGAIFATGVTIGTALGGGEDAEQVRTVLERLREVGAVRGVDPAHPRVNVLGPDQQNRMARHMPEVGSYAERLRADLAVYDRGGQVHAGAFIKTEAAIRTGYTEADSL